MVKLKCFAKAIVKSISVSLSLLPISFSLKEFIDEYKRCTVQAGRITILTHSDCVEAVNSEGYTVWSFLVGEKINLAKLIDINKDCVEEVLIETNSWIYCLSRNGELLWKKLKHSI